MLNRISPPRDSRFWTEASEQTQEAYEALGHCADDGVFISPPADSRIACAF